MRRPHHFFKPIVRPVFLSKSIAAHFVRCCAVLCLVGVMAGGLNVRPLSAADITFLGHPVSPKPGTYVVTKELNVRAEPDTKGKKIGSFQEGERIDVAGSAKGSWMAVRVDGKDLGFVYGPVLMPLINAVVEEPLTGKIAISGGNCAYRVVFEGESPIEGQMFNSVDYRAVLECRRGGSSFAFDMPLFITEGPYNGGDRSIHQIGMDVLELAQEYERVFSTNLLYDAEKGRVKLDSVSVDKYLAKKKEDPVPVVNVATALVAAIGLAARSWTPAFWSDLARALRASGG